MIVLALQFSAAATLPVVMGPHLKKDIVQLGKVQKRVTKTTKGVEQLPYEKSLQHMGFQFGKMVCKGTGGHDTGIYRVYIQIQR